MKFYKISFKLKFWSTFGSIIVEAGSEEAALIEFKLTLTDDRMYNITSIERVNNKTTI